MIGEQAQGVAAAPTLILLFGADIKLAGSLSLAVSLPTLLVGFARYKQHRSFAGHLAQPDVSAVKVWQHGRPSEPNSPVGSHAPACQSPPTSSIELL